MYYSISDQLKRKTSLFKSHEELREMTCNYMLKNKDDFLPYLHIDDVISIDEERYIEYCNKIKDPTVWGGHIELKALSDILDVLIEVIQSDGPEILIGNESKERLVLTYHRHMFGSGEHYNSTEPLIKTGDDSSTNHSDD